MVHAPKEVSPLRYITRMSKASSLVPIVFAAGIVGLGSLIVDMIYLSAPCVGQYCETSRRPMAAKRRHFPTNEVSHT